MNSEGSDCKSNGPIPHGLMSHFAPFVMRCPPANSEKQRLWSEGPQAQGELYTIITTTEKTSNYSYDGQFHLSTEEKKLHFCEIRDFVEH